MEEHGNEELDLSALQLSFIRTIGGIVLFSLLLSKSTKSTQPTTSSSTTATTLLYNLADIYLYLYLCAYIHTYIRQSGGELDEFESIVQYIYRVPLFALFVDRVGIPQPLGQSNHSNL